MNIVQVAGRLGKDAEMRFSAAGQKIVTLSIATNVRKNGKEETLWWRATGWGDRFEKIIPYLKKGSAVCVMGEMGKPEPWMDKEGRPQVNLDIWIEVLKLNPFGGERSHQEAGAATGAAAGAAAAETAGENTAAVVSGATYGAAAASSGNSFGTLQQSGYGYSQPQASYGNDGFGGLSTGSSSHDSQEAEEPIPF